MITTTADFPLFFGRMIVKKAYHSFAIPMAYIPTSQRFQRRSGVPRGVRLHRCGPIVMCIIMPTSQLPGDAPWKRCGTRNMTVSLVPCSDSRVGVDKGVVPRGSHRIVALFLQRQKQTTTSLDRSKLRHMGTGTEQYVSIAIKIDNSTIILPRAYVRHNKTTKGTTIIHSLTNK